ncbi:unnamed protein product [marine sediment metagenome]|uniref:Uncharacterized protein n=1 Tax=marine sediment metagenome TaxID=412755 RepID=X1TU45_9ZZZZ
MTGSSEPLSSMSSTAFLRKTFLPEIFFSAAAREIYDLALQSSSSDLLSIRW